MTTPAPISGRIAELTRQIEEHQTEIAAADARMSELAERISLQTNAMHALEKMRSTLQWAVNVYEEAEAHQATERATLVGNPHPPETVVEDDPLRRFGADEKEEEEERLRPGPASATPERDAHQPPAPPIVDPDAPLKQRVIWAMQRLDRPATATEIADTIGNIEPRQIGPVLGKLNSERRIQAAPGGRGGWALVL